MSSPLRLNLFIYYYSRKNQLKSNMTAFTDCRRAHFTYIWAIENASKLPLSKSFRSTTFTMDSEVMEKTMWHLTMDPGKDWITFFIRRVENDNGPESIEIDYEISLLSADGYPLVQMMERKRFKNSSNIALRRLASTDEVFNVRKDEFLTKDTLIVQCRIWRTNFEVSKSDLHYVHTRKTVNRISFVWAIKNFSSLRKDEKRIHIVNPTLISVPRLILTFYLVEKSGKEHIFIQIDKDTESKSHSIQGNVCLLDANGKVHHSVKTQECISLNDGSNWLITALYPRRHLMANKESLLPNDVLTFRCVFEIDSEPFCCQTETYKDLVCSDLEYIVSRLPEIQCDDTLGGSPLQRFLPECFKQGTFSDACLRVGSESFPVHKLILSVSSPIFKDMFTKVKQKKASDPVDISDVDPETLRLLLSYIYTSTLPVLEWERVVQLFIAAEKYKVEDLREICSAFLISNLTVNNCCNILRIADTQRDENLRTVVHEFMINHNTEIFKSDTWKIFKKENFTLAMDTTERIIRLMKRTEDY